MGCGVWGGSKNYNFCLFSIPIQITCAAIDGFLCRQVGMYWDMVFMGKKTKKMYEFKCLH